MRLRSAMSAPWRVIANRALLHRLIQQAVIARGFGCLMYLSA
jgi:hypothetical protein